VALRQLPPRVEHIGERAGEGGRLPGMRQAGADRTADARAPRTIACRAAPRSGGRGSLHPQRRPRPRRRRAVVGAAGLVALRQLRPRVGGEPDEPDGVSVVRRAPGAARAVARRPAARSRRPSCIRAATGTGSVRDRRVLVAEAVVALQRLRPRAEGVRGGALDGRPRLPKLPPPLGSPATVASRPAARYRRPAAPYPQRRPRPRRRRPSLAARRLVALPQLRPGVESLHTRPRPRAGPLPRDAAGQQGEADGRLETTSEKRGFR
jgi:hypothetical protein